MKCPICGGSNCNVFFSGKCGNFDGSSLYKKLSIIICWDCYHSYNEISKENYDRLSKYYEDEYAVANMHSVNSYGDLPGSTSRNSLARYDNIYQAMRSYVYLDSMILDVGCAMGGFLGVLKEKGYSNLFGVDKNWRYSNCVSSSINVILGDALHLPYYDGIMDCIVMDQVLEHLADPLAAVQEAYRVLKDDGVLCIGVPDAEKYFNHELFPFYWLVMREHLQHFSFHSLEKLAGRSGFIIEHLTKKDTPMMSDKMVLPDMITVFRKAKPMFTKLLFGMENNFTQLKELKKKFATLAKNKLPVFCWGIGREFMFLFEEAGLKKCNIQGLVDSNQQKQTLTIKGMSITDPSTLINVPKDAVILVTAFAHKNEIETKLKEWGLRAQ